MTVNDLTPPSLLGIGGGGSSTASGFFYGPGYLPVRLPTEHEMAIRRKKKKIRKILKTRRKKTMTSAERWDDVMRRLVADKLIPAPIYRILLYGPPRTGKSSIAGSLFAKHERATIHKQLPVEDLLGGYALVNGTTKWQDGPAIRALRDGLPLVLDEIDQISPECRCILHALLDDPPGITLASGERVAVKAGYCVIATTNQLPSSLPAPVLDRFDLILCANTLSKDLQASLGDFATQAESVILRDKNYHWKRPASINLFLAASKLKKNGLNDEKIVAALGLFGQDAIDMMISMRGSR